MFAKLLWEILLEESLHVDLLKVSLWSLDGHPLLSVHSEYLKHQIHDVES